jgi:hypothetical protein
MINFDKKQALLSNWISIEAPECPDRSFLVRDMDTHLRVISANIVRYGQNQYIVFRCSYKVLWDSKSKKAYGKLQPEIFNLYISIRGRHAVEGRSLLADINKAIGLGDLDDTKLYKDLEFRVHVAFRGINTFKFNQIGRVLMT